METVNKLRKWDLGQYFAHQIQIHMQNIMQSWKSSLMDINLVSETQQFGSTAAAFESEAYVV